jgi:hypothetical protein
MPSQLDETKPVETQAKVKAAKALKEENNRTILRPD